MFTYCPSCGSQNIAFERNRVFRCPDCGFTYYHNTAAATACIITAGSGAEETILLLVRGKDPGKGKLDLPGGFVDPGEGAMEGLRRELREELGWEPPAGAKTELFASYPNIYPYKNIVYNTCDLFFLIKAPGLTEKDLRLEEKEVAGIRFVKRNEINLEDIAFESARKAVAEYLGLSESLV
jgi:ADP-ribose pyrophosphatase YjhB (NUDIX family)